MTCRLHQRPTLLDHLSISTSTLFSIIVTPRGKQCLMCTGPPHTLSLPFALSHESYEMMHFKTNFPSWLPIQIDYQSWPWLQLLWLLTITLYSGNLIYTLRRSRALTQQVAHPASIHSSTTTRLQCQIYLSWWKWKLAQTSINYQKLDS